MIECFKHFIYKYYEKGKKYMGTSLNRFNK